VRRKQTSYARADRKRQPAKATTPTRRHVATTAITTTDNDCADVANMTRAARQPSPKTGWNPDRRTWEAR
jgi:hypothetical protein